MLSGYCHWTLAFMLSPKSISQFPNQFQGDSLDFILFGCISLAPTETVSKISSLLPDIMLLKRYNFPHLCSLGDLVFPESPFDWLEPKLLFTLEGASVEMKPPHANNSPSLLPEQGIPELAKHTAAVSILNCISTTKLD